MNKILSILLACTAAGAAYGAQETAQETGQAAKNVAIDSVVVTGARYASDIRHLPMSVAVVDRDEIVRRQEHRCFRCSRNRFRGCSSRDAA